MFAQLSNVLLVRAKNLVLRDLIYDLLTMEGNFIVVFEFISLFAYNIFRFLEFAEILLLIME